MHLGNLGELGAINVVCGPNNSGKSTLLRALVAGDGVKRGVALESRTVALIVAESERGMGWSAGSRVESQAYSEIVRQAAASREVWFDDDDHLFVDAVEERFKSSRSLARWRFSAAAVSRAFGASGDWSFDALLIPPKRVLQHRVEVRASEDIRPDGVGLVNFLFMAQNQPPGSSFRMVFEEIAQAFEDISEGFRLGVFISKDNNLEVSFRSPDGTWVAAPECGLGLQDLLVILYASIALTCDLLCLEEPENHLHPDLQRHLMLFLASRQQRYFLTTHSNIFLDSALVHRVFLARCDAGRISLVDSTGKASMLGDLGYSVADNLVSDLVVLVEGPSDVAVLEELFLKMNLYGKYRIKLWPLGGDVMDQLDLSVFMEGYRVVALVDRDPGSSRVRKRFVENCGKVGVEVRILQRYAIENYFGLDALRSVFGGQVPSGVVDIDPDKKLEDQIGLSVKKRARNIAREMTLGDLEGTDLMDFLREVERLCVSGL